jgi:hypothetical protein
MQSTTFWEKHAFMQVVSEIELRCTWENELRVASMNDDDSDNSIFIYLRSLSQTSQACPPSLPEVHKQDQFNKLEFIHLFILRAHKVPGTVPGQSRNSPCPQESFSISQEDRRKKKWEKGKTLWKD